MHVILIFETIFWTIADFVRFTGQFLFEDLYTGNLLKRRFITSIHRQSSTVAS